MAADEKSTLKLFFDCRFHTLHTRVPTQKLNEICVYVYQTALKYAVGTCMWIHWVKLEQFLWNSFDVK
jgi:hypothetical protein